MNTYGLFKIERIIIQAGRILFRHDWAAQPKASDALVSPVQRMRPTTQTQNVMVYPRFGALKAHIKPSSSTHLQSQRDLELVIEVGNNTIHEGRVSLRAASAGLRMHTANATILDGEDVIRPTTNPGDIQLRSCSEESIIRIKIPYQAELTAVALTVGVHIDYRTDAGKFTFRSSSNVDIAIPLDVSVQDTIKQDLVLSKFWLRPVGERPLLVLDAELEGSGKYETRPLLQQDLKTVVSSSHPLCVSYRVQLAKRTPDLEPDDVPGQPLVFRVKFRNIAQDLVDHMRQKLKHDVADSSFAMYGGLLLYHLEERMQAAMNKVEFKHAGITGAVQLPAYDDARFESIVQLLQRPRQEALAEWVRDWYNVSYPHQMQNQHVC